MSARLARTADGWWVVTPAELARLDLPAATTAGLLADRAALAAAIEAGTSCTCDCWTAASVTTPTWR